MEQRGGEGEARGQPKPVGLERQRQAETHEYDADVLDRAVGEQAFEILLHQGVQDAQHRGDASEAKHDDAPRPGWRSQQVEDDPDEGVDGNLGHDATHQGGDVTGRGRMGKRQPDVQRHQAGLRSGAEQHQDEHEYAGRLAVLDGTDRGKPVASRGSGEQAECQQQRQRAEARHHQIDIARPCVAGFAVMRHDQRPRCQRHEFPAQQKGEGVVRQHHEIHAGKKSREEWQHAVGGGFVTAVAQAVAARRGAAEIDHDQKKAASPSYLKLAPSHGNPNGNLRAATAEVATVDNCTDAIARATTEAVKVAL